MKTKGLKLLALIMGIIFAISLVGCAKADKDSTATDKPTEEPTAAPTETNEPEAVLNVRGSWSDTVYTNTFLGLSYTLPEGWVAASDEEILDIMGLGAEVLGNEEALQSALEKQQTVYDFMVQDSATGSNISISFENLSLTIGGSNFSEKDYANAVTSQLKALEELSYVVGDVEEVIIGEKTFWVVPASVEYQGISMQQNYYLHKEGNFMCCIILTNMAPDTQTPEQLLEAFTKA